MTDTEINGGDKLSKSSVSRRNALKAGVATGVGIAAIAGPQIGRLGAVPAYASHCSPGKFKSTLSMDRNVDCGGNCGGGTFRLHEQEVTLIYNGITIRAKQADKICANVATPVIEHNPGTGFVAGTPTGVQCRLRAVLTNSQGVPLPGQPEFPLPSTNFNKNTYPCSSRYAFRLICAPTGCFH